MDNDIDEKLFQDMVDRLARGEALDPVEQRQLVRIASAAHARAAALKASLQPTAENLAFISGWLVASREREGWGNEGDWTHEKVLVAILHMLRTMAGMG